MSLKPLEDERSEVSPPTLGQRLRGLIPSPRRLASWAVANPMRAALVGMAGLASVGAVAIVWLAVGLDRSPVRIDPKEALKALDRDQLDEAKRLAGMLSQQKDIAPDHWGTATFVLGMAAAREAQRTTSAFKKDLWTLASRYLEDSRDKGFPPGRNATGLLTLGKSLLHSGRSAASRAVLQEALKANPAEKTRINSLLANACLGGPRPLLPEALQYNELALADAGLTAEGRLELQVQRAEILLRMGRLAESLKRLDELPASAQKQADVLLLRGWAAMEEARAFADAKDRPVDATAVRAKYRAALANLQTAQQRDTLETQISSKAMYLRGVCWQQSGDDQQARKEFTGVAREYPDSPETLAANFQSAESARRAGQDREALALYRKVLLGVGDAANYSNVWFPLEELRSRVLKVCQAYFDKRNFAACLTLAGALSPLFPQTQGTELTAETYQAWGRSLLEQTENLPPSKAEPRLREGRKLMRSAGKSYARLAALRIVQREYPDDLWASAECYLEGQDYNAAVKVLQEYLKNEARRRYPRALVNLGEAMLALGRLDDALEAFSECMRFYSRDAASFHARLGAAHAYLEKNDPGQAKKLLQENLSGEYLAPGSEEWRQSLFTLGRVLHKEGRYAEAIERLEEAVNRYPTCPQAAEARYLIAESYRLSARQIRGQLQKDVLDNVRQARTQQVSERLQAALVWYQQLGDELGHRQRTHELGRLERVLLRNCTFSVGTVLFDLGRYDAAVKAFTVAVNRYQGSPEVLEAYVQLARCYRRLNRVNEARTALDQAKIALARLPDGLQFTETTNYSKQDWSSLLDRLTSG
jgi:tetratricopeptide (TPR) repeat protein